MKRIKNIISTFFVVALTLMISTQDFVHYLLHEHFKVSEKAEFNHHNERDCLICGNHTSDYILHDFDLYKKAPLFVVPPTHRQTNTFAQQLKLLNYGRAPPRRT